jgi:hypothetical protein
MTRLTNHALASSCLMAASRSHAANSAAASSSAAWVTELRAACSTGSRMSLPVSRCDALSLALLHPCCCTCLRHNCSHSFADARCRDRRASSSASCAAISSLFLLSSWVAHASLLHSPSLPASSYDALQVLPLARDAIRFLAASLCLSASNRIAISSHRLLSSTTRPSRRFLSSTT